MPHFLKRNSGIFAIMSSSAGKAGVPYSGTYTGSKHALHVGYFKSILLQYLTYINISTYLVLY